MAKASPRELDLGTVLKLRGIYTHDPVSARPLPPVWIRPYKSDIRTPLFADVTGLLIWRGGNLDYAAYLGLRVLCHLR